MQNQYRAIREARSGHRTDLGEFRTLAEAKNAAGGDVNRIERGDATWTWYDGTWRKAGDAR